MTITDRPKDAGAPEIEVTPDMIEAGVHAYNLNAIWGWDNPGLDALREMVRVIYVEMKCSRRDHQQDASHTHRV